MGKEAYYFPHDCNARNDDKIIAVRMKYGMEGYGIYFAIIEKLRESADYKCVKDYNIIAFDLRVDASKIKHIIEDFGLFVFTECDKYLYSESLNKRMQHFDEIRKKRSDAGKTGMEKRWKSTELQQNDNNVITELQQSDNNIVKENKLNNLSLESAVREISEREREIFFEILFFEKGIKTARSEIERFINHYQSTGWLNKDGVAIHDRCALLRNWDTKGAAVFPPEFVNNWREMYELSAKLNPEKIPIFSFISDFYDIKKTETDIVLQLSEKLRNFIENNLDVFREPLQKILAGRNLRYEIM